MEIELNDLFETRERKPKYQTIAFSERDERLIAEAKNVFGKKNVAEIMRRSIRAGIAEALQKFGTK